MSHYSLAKVTTMLCLCGMIILFASCGNKDKKNSGTNEKQASTQQSQNTHASSTDLQQIFKSPGLHQWKQQMEKDYPHFSVDRFEKKAVHTLPNKTEVFPQDKWEIFAPYFVPSPDQEQAVDLYSYGDLPPDSGRVPEGGMPDSEINLIHLSEKTKTRLLFAGPGTTFQKAEWLNNHLVIITGESDANQQNEMLPVCWKINTKDGTIITFDYQNIDAAQ